MQSDQSRSKLVRLVFGITFGLIGLLASQPAQAQNPDFQVLGHYERGNFTENRIIYFCVEVRGPFNAQNAQQKFTAAVQNQLANNESWTWDGREAGCRTQDGEIFVLAGWFNPNFGEGAWVAIKNDTPTTSVALTNSGEVIRSNGFHNVDCRTAGYSITIRYADNDDSSIMVGIGSPH